MAFSVDLDALRRQVRVDRARRSSKTVAAVQPPATEGLDAKADPTRVRVLGVVYGSYDDFIRDEVAVTYSPEDSKWQESNLFGAIVPEGEEREPSITGSCDHKLVANTAGFGNWAPFQHQLPANAKGAEHQFGLHQESKPVTCSADSQSPPVNDGRRSELLKYKQQAMERERVWQAQNSAAIETQTISRNRVQCQPVASASRSQPADTRSSEHNQHEHEHTKDALSAPLRAQTASPLGVCESQPSARLSPSCEAKDLFAHLHTQQHAHYLHPAHYAVGEDALTQAAWSPVLTPSSPPLQSLPFDHQHYQELRRIPAIRRSNPSTHTSPIFTLDGSRNISTASHSSVTPSPPIRSKNSATPPPLATLPLDPRQRQRIRAAILGHRVRRRMQMHPIQSIVSKIKESVRLHGEMKQELKERGGDANLAIELQILRQLEGTRESAVEELAYALTRLEPPVMSATGASAHAENNKKPRKKTFLKKGQGRAAVPLDKYKPKRVGQNDDQDRTGGEEKDGNAGNTGGPRAQDHSMLTCQESQRGSAAEAARTQAAGRGCAEQQHAPTHKELGPSPAGKVSLDVVRFVGGEGYADDQRDGDWMEGKWLALAPVATTQESSLGMESRGKREDKTQHGIGDSESARKDVMPSSSIGVQERAWSSGSPQRDGRPGSGNLVVNRRLKIATEPGAGDEGGNGSVEGKGPDVPKIAKPFLKRRTESVPVNNGPLTWNHVKPKVDAKLKTSRKAVSEAGRAGKLQGRAVGGTNNAGFDSDKDDYQKDHTQGGEAAATNRAEPLHAVVQSLDRRSQVKAADARIDGPSAEPDSGRFGWNLNGWKGAGDEERGVIGSDRARGGRAGGVITNDVEQSSQFRDMHESVSTLQRPESPQGRKRDCARRSADKAMDYTTASTRTLSLDDIEFLLGQLQEAQRLGSTGRYGEMLPNTSIFPLSGSTHRGDDSRSQDVPRLYANSRFFSSLSDKERAIEVSMAVSRSTAPIISDYANAYGNAAAPQVAFRRVNQ
jgi:hypothetical protein